MRLGMKIIGDIKKDALKFSENSARAVTAAARETGKGLKMELRGQIKSAGMGDRLANTWRDNVFPKRGNSMNAATTVVSKAPHIIDSFDRGVVIRAKNRRFLAIPTQFAPKTAAGFQMTPANFEAKTGLKLFFVPRRGKNPLLVTKNTKITAAGRIRKLTTSRATKNFGPRTSLTGNAWVPMFTLVPQSKMRKKLNVEGVIPKWQQSFVANIERKMSNAAK